jgi:hypothetical protein
VYPISFNHFQTIKSSFYQITTTKHLNYQTIFILILYPYNL